MNAQSRKSLIHHFSWHFWLNCQQLWFIIPGYWKLRNYCRREWLRLGGLRGTMVVINNLISTVWPRSASSNRNFYHCWATSLWNRTEILIMPIDRRSPHTYQWQSVCSISTRLEYIMKQRLGRSWRSQSMKKLAQIIYTKWGYDIVVFHEDENPLFPICSFSVCVLHLV